MTPSGYTVLEPLDELVVLVDDDEVILAVLDSLKTRDFKFERNL